MSITLTETTPLTGDDLLVLFLNRVKADLLGLVVADIEGRALFDVDLTLIRGDQALRQYAAHLRYMASDLATGLRG